MAKEKGEKTNLYLLSIVAIVAIVGIVVLILNNGARSSAGEATTFEVDGQIFTSETSSSDDLTGQVLRGAKCGKIRDLTDDDGWRDCYYSGGVCRC